MKNIKKHDVIKNTILVHYNTKTLGVGTYTRNSDRYRKQEYVEKFITLIIDGLIS